jgi:hypothetical protein
MVKVTQYLTHTEEIKAYATVRARFLGSLRSLFHGSSAFPWSGITNLWCLRRKGAHQVRRARYRVSLARHGYVCRGSFVKVFRKAYAGSPTDNQPGSSSSEAELRLAARWLLINLKGSIGYLADPRPAPVSFTAESIACARYSAGSLPKARRKTREKLLRLA